MLVTKVKASAITHLTDARYFAAWYVDWLGFYLSKGTAKSVEEPVVHALREWVDGVKICGEFGLTDAAELADSVERLQLDAVQVGPFTPVEALEAVAGKTEIIQEVVLEHYSDVDAVQELQEERKEIVQYFLLNFTKGGISYHNLLKDAIPFPLTQLQEWSAQYPILLDISLDGAAPTEVLKEVSAKGFCVQGSAEEKVGYKSFDDLDGFFEDLEE